MPLMDGLELLEELAYVRRDQGTPVVVIREHTSQEGVLRAIEAGARAYIRKPFTVKDLSEKIEPLLADKLETAKTWGFLRGIPGGINGLQGWMLF